MISLSIFIPSHGIRRIQNLRSFLPECHQIISSARSEFQVVAGWGNRPTADKAKALAKRHTRPYWALEDGFLRSVRLGRDGESPLSLVVDPVGIYYDARGASQLEQWLERGEWAQPELLVRAAAVRNWLIAERLSKYNQAAEKQLWNDNDAERVLVIDQTFGDMSVEGALASEQSFQEMLQAALVENPSAQVVVKTHPDVVAGYRQGYLGQIPDDPRIQLLTEDVHPWSVLDGVSKVYTVSSLLGFEALLSGKPVRCFGMPFYAGWGLTEDEVSCERRTRRCSLNEIFAAAYLKYARYVDPITGTACEIEKIIALLSDRRRHWLQTRGKTYCSQVSLWKRNFLPAFLSQEKNQVHFVRKPETALTLANRNHARWALWASAETTQLREQAESQGIGILRIEDAFLRSVGLGSDLARPWSLVLDDEGIYYDSSRPSRLETLLRETDFSPDVLSRAGQLQQQILQHGLTKYNVGEQAKLDFPEDAKIKVLVPGQVEDDASIIRGAGSIKRNLNLLQAVREARPGSYIIYKPHPDVLVGNRRGSIPAADALRFADTILTNVSINSLLDNVNEVHTMTSLTGFEALLRGCRVSTYGMPFYAGWGLTEDRMICSRRGRDLSLVELLAGTLLLYPTYVDPRTGQICSVEHLLDWLAAKRRTNAVSTWRTRLIRCYQNWRQGE